MLNEQDLRNHFPTVTRLIHIARGALRRLRPHVIDADSHAHVEGLKASSEGFRRSARSEHTRVEAEIHQEESTARRRAADVAVYQLRSAGQYVDGCRQWLDATRRNAALSFPDALNHVTADGMISLALLRDRRRTAVLTMTADQLLAAYLRTFNTQDAAALVDLQLIEDTVQDGTSLAMEAADLPVLKKLREHIAGIQSLRVPTDLPDFEALATDLASLYQRAGVLKLGGANPDHDPVAAAAYREQESALLEVGARSDREDLAAVQQELTKASGQ